MTINYLETITELYAFVSSDEGGEGVIGQTVTLDGNETFMPFVCAAKAQAEKEKAIEQAKEEVKRKGAEELKKMQDMLNKPEPQRQAEQQADPEQLKAIEAQRELERQRVAELEKAKQQAEELKRREIIEKERVAKEVALKKQDPNHQSAIHADVLFGLTFFCGLDQEQAQAVLDNIKSGNIDHLKIEY